MTVTFTVPQTGLTQDEPIRAVRRVLIVDDSAAQLLMLEKLLSRWDYEVFSAASVPEALALARDAPPDLVLSDWIMPGMDGLTFCRLLREENAQHFSYFILLSARSEKSEVAKGLDAGADDYLSKPVSAQELRARIHAADRIVRMQRELLAKNDVISKTLEELRRVHSALDRDLRHARRIQQSLVPERARDFGRGRVSMLLQPCGHVGGDLVGVFEARKDRIGIYGIDVSGHGVASALVAARIAGHLSSRLPGQNVAMGQSVWGPSLLPPNEVAAKLNDRLEHDPGIEEYFTMLYATFDLTTGQGNFVQAGHPCPLMIRADGRIEALGNGGLPIGLIAKVSHECTSFTMMPGDRLLICSDGFIEAERESGDLLGSDGLIEIVRKVEQGLRGTEYLDGLLAGLMSAMGSGQGLSDDVSAALLEYEG